MITLAIPDNQNMEVSSAKVSRAGSEGAGEPTAILDNTGPVVDWIPGQQHLHSLSEVSHETEISKGVNVRPDRRIVDRDCGTSRDCASVADSAKIAHPVPRLSLVNPVPHGSTKPRASGSTSHKKAGSTRELHPVPQFKGYKWKPSGLTGWELYTRKPSISRNGKRSSKGKYLGYYSKEAVRVLYEATQKTTDARRA